MGGFAYPCYIIFRCGSLWVVKTATDEGKVHTQRIGTQRVATEFENILPPYRLLHDIILISVAHPGNWSCGMTLKFKYTIDSETIF